MSPRSAFGRGASIFAAFAILLILSPARAEERRVEFKQVAPDLYFLYDFDSSNAVVLATDEGVLVIDTRQHPRDGQDLIDGFGYRLFYETASAPCPHALAPTHPQRSRGITIKVPHLVR